MGFDHLTTVLSESAVVFGTPVNRRIGNGWYLTAYLGTATAIGLFVRMFVSGNMLGASGAIFAVIAVAVILMPSSIIDVAYILATLSARKKAADFKKKMATTSNLGESGSAADNAFAKFDRLREKVERAEAEADAFAELQSTNPSNASDEFDFPSRAEDDVDDELQALKKKLLK